MQMPSYADSFEVLCLQAADNGRKNVLFGDCVDRARVALRPFMVGKAFPSVYLEFPLMGEPFMDVTVLYGKLEPHTRIDSNTVLGMEPLLDWYAGLGEEYSDVCFGFELDVKDPSLPKAAVHFEPRAHTELVEPFCRAIGEPDRAQLYMQQTNRMPEEWPLAFFGLFRGRPGSAMRVCGYLGNGERDACAADPARVARAFDEVGFAAYDDAMLEQVSTFLATVPGSVDFQFDVSSGGEVGGTFAIDAKFDCMQPADVVASFASGPGARLMQLFEAWGIADERWRLVADATFARALPVDLEDGSQGRCALTLMPQWVKVRWCDGILQPAKLYHFANAALMR